MFGCACWPGCRKSRKETDSDGIDTLNNAKTLKKLSVSPASQQKPDRTTAPFRNACSQSRRYLSLIVNKPSFLPSSSASSPPTEKIHHKPTEKRPGSHLVHTFMVMHTVKDISQTALPVTPNSPSYNGHRAGDSVHASAHEQRGFYPLAPSTVSLAFPRPLACPINHYYASSSHRTFVPASLLVDDNFRAAPSSYLRFSSTTTSKVYCSTCRLQRVQLPSHNARSLARAITQKREQKHPQRSR
ncbi:unnamed protein product [Sphagnum balticum]